MRYETGAKCNKDYHPKIRNLSQGSLDYVITVEAPLWANKKVLLKYYNLSFPNHAVNGHYWTAYRARPVAFLVSVNFRSAALKNEHCELLTQINTEGGT